MGERMTKTPITTKQAQDLETAFCTARDHFADSCDWIVARYKDKKTRQCVAKAWRAFSEHWIAIEDQLVDRGAERPFTGMHLANTMRHLPQKMLPRPTIEEHNAIGAKLMFANNTMIKIWVELGNAIALEHRAVKGAYNIETLLSKLRSRMDDIVCEEHPVGNGAIDCYYGHLCRERATTISTQEARS
jgi:hypothetical protein